MDWAILFFLIVGWLLFKIVDAISKSSSNVKKKQAFKAEVQQKYPARIVHTSLDLFERNNDIIDTYLNKVSIRSGGRIRYYIENLTRDCINDICLAENEQKLRPNNSYLSDWRRRTSQEWLELSQKIETLFSSRKKELEANQRREQERQREENVLRLLSEYSEWLAQFNTIAYRKVTTLDDYGEENWDLLDKEAELLVVKIAKKEGFDDKKIKDWKKHTWSMPQEYKQVKATLITSFKEYYRTRKSEPTASKDLSVLSGIEFEIHIAELLKENGFTQVAGTSKVGDQGGDLIAKKNGKTVVIQAKRYESNVGNKAVQEVVGAIKFYDADEGWVITNSNFTKAARELASKNNIKLIDGKDLEQFQAVVSTLI